MFTFPYAPISICFIYPYAPIILSCVQTLQSCAYCSFVLFVLFSSLHQNLTFSQSPFQVVDVVKQVFFVEIEICPKLRFWINVSSDTIAYSEMAKKRYFKQNNYSKTVHCLRWSILDVSVDILFKKTVLQH